MPSPLATDEITIELPILNVSDTSAANGKRLVQAAADYGFLYISPQGTPFTESMVEEQFELSKKFFALSPEEKEDYHVGTDNRAWLGMHNERLNPRKHSKEYKEAFNIGESDDRGASQQKMPPCLSDNHAMTQLRTFEEACNRTCAQILDLIAIGLEVEGGTDWFSERHGKPSGCTVRLLHYPALDAEVSIDEDVRAGAHSDYGSITLLFQRPGQPGLEIRPPGGSDKWSPVSVFPPSYVDDTLPPILVNIGDLMSYWTDGLLRSTVHRVIFPRDTQAKQDRYSIAFFCHPLDDAELVPVPSRSGQAHKAKSGRLDEQSHGYGGGMAGSRALTAKEHLMRRLAATHNNVEER